MGKHPFCKQYCHPSSIFILLFDTVLRLLDGFFLHTVPLDPFWPQRCQWVPMKSFVWLK